MWCLLSMFRYIPVLMVQAKIYWDLDNYAQVEKVIRPPVRFAFVSERVKVKGWAESVDFRVSLCLECLKVGYKNWFWETVPDSNSLSPQRENPPFTMCHLLQIFRKSVEFCNEHEVWKLNVAHVLFMQVCTYMYAFLFNTLLALRLFVWLLAQMALIKNVLLEQESPAFIGLPSNVEGKHK